MQTATCLRITPDGKITPEKLVFDFANAKTAETRRAAIIDTLRQLVGCNYYTSNVAKAAFPNESFYHAAYQQNSYLSNKPLNKVASHIIQYLYNNDSSYNLPARQCYGDCYIIHLDGDMQLCDASPDVFINCYNKVYTSSEGIREREYGNRIYREAQQCYLYQDYKNRNY